MIEEPHRCVRGSAGTVLAGGSTAERRRAAHAPATAAGLGTRVHCPLHPAPRRVLPLNQICAGTLRALRLMMEDFEGAADVARVAPTTDAPVPGPPKAVAVQMGDADDSFKPTAVVTARHRGSSNGRGPAAEAETWSALPAAAGAAGATAVELSGHSGVPTPSAARATSSDMPDTFAGRLL